MRLDGKGSYDHLFDVFHAFDDVLGHPHSIRGVSVVSYECE